MGIPQTVLELFGVDGTTDVTPAPLLTYTDIQNHLKLDGTTDAPDVSAYISAATKRIEQYLDRKLVTQHWSIYFDCFPRDYKQDEWWDGSRDGAVSQLYSENSPIDLPFGPCQSIAFIHAIDQTDGTVTVDASAYSVDTVGATGRIALKIGGLWPTTILRPVNGVHVRGIFGIGSASVVPHDIKLAVKLQVASFYEKRGDDSDPTIPKGAQLLLEPYRRWKIK